MPRLVRSVLPALFALVASTGTRAEAASDQPLSLADAEALALRQQPLVREAAADVDVAAARADEASAVRWPQLAGLGVYNRQTGNFVPRPGATIVNPVTVRTSATTYDFFSFGATASLLLVDFGQARGRVHAAEASTEAARASFALSRVRVVQAARRAYFQVRAQREFAAVAAQAAENARRHLEQIDAQVAAGTRPGIDRARGVTDLENARVDLVGAENALADVRAELARALGAQAAVFEPTDAEFPPLADEGASLDVLQERALRERPDLAALERQVRAQGFAVRAAERGHAPSLFANASASEAGRALDDLVPNWAVGASLVVPIFQGGLVTATVRENEAALRRVEAALDDARLTARVEVEHAWRALAAAVTARGAAEKAAAAAADQLRLAESRFATGLGIALELADAQLSNTRAAAQAVGARYAVSQARVALAAALGR